MKGFWNSKQSVLKGPCTNLLGLTPFELQRCGISLKGTRDIWGETELSGIRARAGGSFLPDRSANRGLYSFDEPSPNRARRWAPHLSLHQPSSHYLPCPGDSLRLPHSTFGPTQAISSGFFMQMSRIEAHASNFPKISQTNST